MEDMLQLKEEDNDNFFFQHIFLSTLPPHERDTGQHAVQHPAGLPRAGPRSAAAHQRLRRTDGHSSIRRSQRGSPEQQRTTDNRAEPAHHGGNTTKAQQAERHLLLPPPFRREGVQMRAPLQVQKFGKRQSREPLTAAALGEKNELLYVTDGHTRRQFLIDTGAQLSFITPSHADRAMGPRGNGAMAANGSIIDTFGERNLPLCIHGRNYRWTFIVAAVSFNLLGADFLCAHGLLVDLANRRLVNALSFSSIPCSARVSPPPVQASVTTAGGQEVSTASEDQRADRVTAVETGSISLTTQGQVEEREDNGGGIMLMRDVGFDMQCLLLSVGISMKV
ncbi:uncharacterized protein KZ484_016197 [Pholidichthys leucotaenia]